MSEDPSNYKKLLESKSSKKSKLHHKAMLKARMGRLILLESEAPRAHTRQEISGRLENTLVISSIAAGVVGVLIILVIILSLWVKRRTERRTERGGSDLEDMESHSEQSDYITASVSTSTLDITVEQVTQVEEFHDETTFYSANDVSIPGPKNSSFKDEIQPINLSSLDEICLSPI